MSTICDKCHKTLHRFDRFAFPFDVQEIPQNGIYILFEVGERAHSGDRVVRVGTHTGRNQLRSRLKQHFIIENKDRSILRKNIGRALLNRDQDLFLEQWNWDLTTNKAKAMYKHLVDWNRQQEVEKAVTQYIQQHFSFVVFEIPLKEDRLVFESRIVSTVSQCVQCHPSSEWLGLWSPQAKIRESGLWQVNELYKSPLSENELVELQQLAFTGEAG